MERLAGRVDGFTTNPTLIRKAGCTSYLQFILDALRVVDGKPISFEVVGDDWLHEGLRLSSYAENIVVKIPCIYLDGTSTAPLVSRLAAVGVKVNVGVNVRVGVSVSVGVNVFVGVFVGVSVWVDVGVNVAVSVLVESGIVTESDEGLVTEPYIRVPASLVISILLKAADEPAESPTTSEVMGSV